MDGDANATLMMVVQTGLANYRKLVSAANLEEVPSSEWPNCSTYESLLEILKASGYPGADEACQALCQLLTILLERIHGTPLADEHPDVAVGLAKISAMLGKTLSARDLVKDKQVATFIEQINIDDEVVIDLKAKKGVCYRAKAIFEGTLTIQIILCLEEGRLLLKEKIVACKETSISVSRFYTIFDHVRQTLQKFCDFWGSTTYHKLIIMIYMLCMSCKSAGLNKLEVISQVLSDFHSYLENTKLLAFLMSTFLTLCFKHEQLKDFSILDDLQVSLEYFKNNQVGFRTCGIMEEMSHLNKFIFFQDTCTIEIDLIRWDCFQLFKLVFKLEEEVFRLCYEDGREILIESILEAIFYLNEIAGSYNSTSLSFLRQILFLYIRRKATDMVNFDRMIQPFFKEAMFVENEQVDLWEVLRMVFQKYQEYCGSIIEQSENFICQIMSRSYDESEEVVITPGIVFRDTLNNQAYNIDIQEERLILKLLMDGASSDMDPLDALNAQISRLENQMQLGDIYTEILFTSLVRMLMFNARTIAQYPSELMEKIMGLVTDQEYYMGWLLRVLVWIQKLLSNAWDKLILLAIETIRTLIIKKEYPGSLIKDCSDISVYVQPNTTPPLMTIELEADYNNQPHVLFIKGKVLVHAATDKQIEGKSLLLTIIYLLNQLRIAESSVETICRLLVLLIAVAYSELKDLLENEFDLLMKEVINLLEKSYKKQAENIQLHWNDFKAEQNFKKLFKRLCLCWGLGEHGERKSKKKWQKLNKSANCSIKTLEAELEKLVSLKQSTTVLHPLHHLFPILTAYLKQGDEIKILFILIDYNDDEIKAYFICKNESEGTLVVFDKNLKKLTQDQLIAICEVSVVRLESLIQTSENSEYEVGIAPEMQLFCMMAICAKSEQVQGLCDRFLLAVKTIIHSVSALKNRPSSSALLLLLSSLLDNSHLCTDQHILLVRKIVVNWRRCITLTSSNFDENTNVDFTLTNDALICDISGNYTFKLFVLNLTTGTLYEDKGQTSPVRPLKMASLAYHIRENMIKESSKYSKTQTQQVVKLLFVICASLRCMTSRVEYVEDFVRKCGELLLEVLTVFLKEWEGFTLKGIELKLCVEEIITNLETREEQTRKISELTEEDMKIYQQSILSQQEKSEQEMMDLSQQLEELKRLELESSQEMKLFAAESNKLTCELVSETEKVKKMTEEKEALLAKMAKLKARNARLQEDEKAAKEMLESIQQRQEEIKKQTAEMQRKQSELEASYKDIEGLSAEKVILVKKEKEVLIAQQKEEIAAMKRKVAEGQAALKEKQEQYKMKQKLVNDMKTKVKEERENVSAMETKFKADAKVYANNKKKVDKKMKQINETSAMMKQLEDKVMNARANLIAKNAWSKRVLERTKAITGLMNSVLTKVELRRKNKDTGIQQFCPVNMLTSMSVGEQGMELTFLRVGDKSPVIEFRALITKTSSDLWTATSEDLKHYSAEDCRLFHTMASLIMMRFENEVEFYNNCESILDSLLEIRSLYQLMFVFCLTDSQISIDDMTDKRPLITDLLCKRGGYRHCFDSIVAKMQELVKVKPTKSFIQVFNDFTDYLTQTLKIETIGIPENLFKDTGITLSTYVVNLGSSNLSFIVYFDNINSCLTIHDTKTKSPIPLSLMIVVANAMLNDLYDELNVDMENYSLHDRILDQSYKIIVNCIYILYYTKQLPTAMARAAFEKLCRVMQVCLAFNPLVVALIQQIAKETEPLSTKVVVDLESLIDLTNEKFGRYLKTRTVVADFEQEQSLKTLISKGQMRINPIIVMLDKGSKKLEMDVYYLDDGSVWTFLIPTDWQKIVIHKKEKENKREIDDNEIEHEIEKLIGYLRAADYHVLSILQVLLILLWCAEASEPRSTPNFLNQIHSEIKKKPSYVNVESGLAYVGTMFKRIWEISLLPNNCYIQLYEIFTESCNKKLVSFVNQDYQSWLLEDTKTLYGDSNDDFLNVFNEAQLNQHSSSVDKTAKRNLSSHHHKKDHFLEQGPLDTQLCLASLNALGLLEEFKFEELYHSLYNVFILCLVKLQKQPNQASHLTIFLVQMWHQMRKMEVSVSEMHLVGHMIWQMLECIYHFKQEILKTLTDSLPYCILLEKQFYEKQIEDLERGLIIVSINLLEYIFPNECKAIFLSSKNNQHKSVFKVLFKTDTDYTPEISLITNIETVNQASREMEQAISIGALELICVEAQSQAKILFCSDKSGSMTQTTTHMNSCINFFKQLYILYMIFMQINKGSTLDKTFLENILLPVGDCRMQEGCGDSTFDTKSAKELILGVIKSGVDVSFKDYTQFCFSLNQFVTGVAKDRDFHMQVDKKKEQICYLFNTEETTVKVVVNSSGCSVKKSSVLTTDRSPLYTHPDTDIDVEMADWERSDM